MAYMFPPALCNLLFRDEWLGMFWDIVYLSRRASSHICLCEDLKLLPELKW